MKTWIVLTALLLGTLTACKTTPEAAPAEAAAADASQPVEVTGPEAEAMLEEGRELTRLFYQGETETLWSRMNGEMQAALGSEEGLVGFQQKVQADVGTETDVLDEQVFSAPPHSVYLRTASFSGFDQPIAVQWALDGEGKIAGFFVRPVQ